MLYQHQLADRMRTALQDCAGVVEKEMFDTALTSAALARAPMVSQGITCSSVARGVLDSVPKYGPKLWP